jgi:predicted nuclease of predicted toxin-antitoxin system
MASGRIRGSAFIEVKLLIDMNLTPSWVEYFAARHIESVHWSGLGDPKALDPEIMEFARNGQFVVFTHDLDFGNVLAVTHARGPSVIQARVEDPLPTVIGDAVVTAIRENAAHLERGALITLDPDKLRVRILPIVPGLKA